MRKLIFIITLLIGSFSNSQEIKCDSIMKQMDVEIENAKKNGADATMINYLEQTKVTLREQFCKDNVFYNNGSNNGSNTNANEDSDGFGTEINNQYVKTRPYTGTPFYGKQKISISVKNYGADGSAFANYDYYVNQEGTLILLDKQSLQGNLSLVPATDMADGGGKFQYWAIRNDGLSTVFGLSDKNKKIAVTTYTKNFLFSPNSSKPTMKKLNQTKSIAGHLCNAYQITAQDEKGRMTMTWWITVKPLPFYHNVMPFTTMFMADKVGFPNLKNHGVLEIDGKHGTESINLKVTKIEPVTKSVQFNGYKEYYFEY
ncbi:hypothetical protein [Flavobacterium sp. U410]